MKPVEFNDFLKNIDYIDVNGNVNGHIRGVEINSRYIEKGDLFFALETGSRSGTIYAEDAIKRGAVAVITERDIDVQPNVKVPNSLDALTDFARYYRSLFSPEVIGITGSVGKTTVKEMLSVILGSKYKTIKNRGNLNNHIGLPYSIFGIEQDTEFALFEMGMNHVGEIEHLTEIAKPNMAVITSIAPCHIGYFKNIDEIFEAKLELYRKLPRGGLFFLNAYDERLKHMKRRKDIDHIVIGDGGDYEIKDVVESKNSIEFTINNVKFGIPIIGRFNVINASLAAAVGDKLGVSLNESAAIMKDYKSIEGRMNILNVNNITVIDDTYNANPTAFKNIIEYIKNNYEGRKFAVIGDMLELGKYSEYYHRELGKELSVAGFSTVLYKGDYFKNIKAGAEKIKVDKLSEKALNNMLNSLNEGDVVLFKGSRGMRMEKWLEKFLKGLNYDL